MRARCSILLVLTAIGCSPGSEGKASNNCVGACDAGLEDADARDLFAPAEEGDWTVHRADVHRTGYAPDSKIGTSVELVWQREGFLQREWTAVKPSGVVWGDTLFYPSDSGVIYAFDRMSGTVRWETELIDRDPGIHGSPVVTVSTVCQGTYAGFLHCLDRETGEEIWRYRIGNVIGSSPSYVPEHNAIYVSHEAPREDPAPGAGYVTKNDPRTGDAIWVSEKLGHWPHASVAVDPERNVVMVGANDGIFHGFDTDTGEEIWQRDFEAESGEADIKGTPALSATRGLVVFGTWDHHVYALDIETGAERWSFDAGGSMQSSAALDDVNGRVFIGRSGSGPSFFAIDLDSGQQLWSATLGSVTSSPAISGDRSRIVVGTADGRVVALEAETGEIVWEFETDGPVSASPTLVGDMIYFAARFGSLYAIRTTN